MFTLIRPLAAIALAVLGWFAAEAYRPLDPSIPESLSFTLWTSGLSAAVGWVFLGGLIGRSLWYSIFAAIQAVVLAAIVVSAAFALRAIFVQGYRRQYREPIEAFGGYFENLLGYLQAGLARDFLILLGAGAVAVGIILHILHLVLERRRMAR